MIPLELLDYSRYKEIDIKVTRYVNKNLEMIIRVLLDILNDDPYFDLDSFFPRDYLQRKPKECRKLVDELYELIRSDVLRDYIKPKYEYLLYTIIQWWDECVDDEEQLLPHKLDQELLAEIESEESYITDDGENFILCQITSYDTYYYICFFDHDFLPEQLSKMITVYVRDPLLFEGFFPAVNLSEYEELMPCDLRELFIEKRNSYNNIPIELVNTEDEIIFEVVSVLQMLETRIVEIEKRDEVEISNDIYTALSRVLKVKFGLESTREMTIGRAKKKLGETDLYIYKNDSTYKRHYAIIENKYSDKFTSQYQQLLGYLNQNFKFGITISINKTLNLEVGIKKIVDKLEEFKIQDKTFKITKICKPFKEFPYVVKSKHIIPEDSKKEMPIYHLVLNLVDSDRVKVAGEARK
jgi:hypothetical protein